MLRDWCESFQVVRKREESYRRKREVKHLGGDWNQNEEKVSIRKNQTFCHSK